MFALKNLIAIALLISTTQISAQELKPAANATDTQLKEAVVTIEPTAVKKEVANDAVTVTATAKPAMQDEINDLEVVEFVLANSVEAKEPREVVETFGLDAERGFAFARLNVKTPTEVTFLWYRNGNLVNRFSTQVHPSKKWRTFSSVKMRPGQWKVQLLQKDKVLAEKTFTLE